MSTNELQAILFYLVAAITALCAIGVVVTQHIVRAATWLLFTLAGTAGVFFLLGADFVAAIQILVYVGGTLVLVVFGVMLTAQSPFISLRASAAEWAIGTVVGFLLFGMLAVSLYSANWNFPEPGQTASPKNSMNSVVLGESLLGFEEATPAANMTGFPPGAAPPSRKAVAYLLPFEIVSVHLLVVLIGAAYLARARRRRQATST
ncbi:MAG: NADH-quinone oxidoreductase subunit J [Gemmatales bacterium]|nr:MAG: NADH-quinone oxidoreductase subunit J [Gemmatales bacterium]